MKKNSLRPVAWWICAVLACLWLAGNGFAQNPEPPLQQFFNFFQGKKAPATPPPLRENSQRLVEIFVELAWLADPLTFPFYLEARALAGQLEVHGNVPSRPVRDQAIKLARLHSTLPVVDAMKENPGLTVRYQRMSPTQLQNAVHTALREALPQQAKFLQTRSSADGRVVVFGRVASFEDKMAISQAVHRLHGCTAVANLVQVAADPDGTLARGFDRPSFSPAAANVAAGTKTPAAQLTGREKLPGADLGQPLIETANAKPSLLPVTTRPAAATPSPAPLAKTDPTRQNSPRVNMAQLKKRIETVCPLARDVQISLLSPTELRIEVRTRPEDIDMVAGQLLSLPELEPFHTAPYHVDLLFK